jgi:hypothetical protein
MISTLTAQLLARFQDLERFVAANLEFLCEPVVGR